MENTQKNKSDEVLILNNSAKMFKERWRRGTWITGTIGTKGISKKIKIGDIFRSNSIYHSKAYYSKSFH